MKPFLEIPVRIWIPSITLLITFIIIDSMFIEEGTGKMIWLISLLPSIFISYYKGLRGGLCIALVAVISNFFITAIDGYENGFVLHDLMITIVGLLLHFSIVISG